MSQNDEAKLAPRSVGYCRVSTVDQNLELQLAALERAGCAPIFQDKISGLAASRPGLDRALELLRAGDTLTVWKLDRLGRSLSSLLHLLDALRAKGVGFRSLTEAIDTTTAIGQLFFSVLGALAQYERDTIQERIRAGVVAARARGKRFGRPRILALDSLATARAALDAGEAVSTVANGLGCSRKTLWRALQRQDEFRTAREHRLYKIGTNSKEGKRCSIPVR